MESVVFFWDVHHFWWWICCKLQTDRHARRSPSASLWRKPRMMEMKGWGCIPCCPSLIGKVWKRDVYVYICLYIYIDLFVHYLFVHLSTWSPYIICIYIICFFLSFFLSFFSVFLSFFLNFFLTFSIYPSIHPSIDLSSILFKCIIIPSLPMILYELWSHCSLALCHCIVQTVGGEAASSGCRRGTRWYPHGSWWLDTGVAGNYPKNDLTLW